MKYLSIITLACVNLLILSCAKSDQKITNTDIQKIASVETDGLSKRYVSGNRFLDVDLNLLNKEINDKTKNKYQKPELAKAKAAVYRFYKNVSLIDGHYVYANKTAKELNISDKLFLLFSDNIKIMNKSIDSLKEKKVAIETPPIDDKYLNDLLN